MSIDWTKPILWDGKPARVLATDLKGSAWPVVIAAYEDGEERTHRCSCDSQHVTNAPERVERWAFAYDDLSVGGTMNADPRTLAIDHNPRRAALVRYTFEGDKLVDVAIVPLELAS